jgi:hypothetical protein
MDSVDLLLKGAILAGSLWIVLIKVPVPWYARRWLWITDALAMGAFIWAATLARSTELVLTTGAAGLVFTFLIHLSAPVMRRITRSTA